MSSEHSDKPYKSPDAANAEARSPGLLAILGIVVATIFAAGCAFFCTCFGVGIVTYGPGFGDSAIFLAIVAGAIAAILVGVTVQRQMYRFATRQKPKVIPQSSDRNSGP